MYQALYRKYRPTTLEDVVGQKVIVKTLTNSIVNDKISHAYLFSGPRGTGKTSIAKIIAKIINCKNLDGVNTCNKCVCCTQTNLNQNVDILEIDAASNNGVEEIREIRNKVNLVPSYGKYKIYIIDEVHMLTTSAFNALLKTLEEPPAHIIFILATTEPHKIPQTILSRCQRYDFKKISTNDIKIRLKQVCKLEHIKINEDALELISIFSDGGMRDALSLLDQLTSYTLNTIKIDDVHDIYGTITEKEIKEFLNIIAQKDIISVYKKINKYDSEGKNLAKIIEQIINYLKNVLIYLNCENYFEDENKKENYKDTLNNLTEEKIYSCINIFLDAIKNIKTTNNVKLVFELTIIKILQKNIDENLDKNIKFQTKETEKIKKEKKEIIIEPKIEEIKMTEEEKNFLSQKKEVRINNTLANFDKKDLIHFKKRIEEMNILLMNPDYSSFVSLILDSELKAKGKNNLIFVFKTDKMQNYFNNSLDIVEKIFYETYNENLKPVAVSEEEWEIIKKDFNDSIKNNEKKYIYKEEPKIEQKQIKPEKKINEIEKIFDETIFYE